MNSIQLEMIEDLTHLAVEEIDPNIRDLPTQKIDMYEMLRRTNPAMRAEYNAFFRGNKI